MMNTTTISNTNSITNVSLNQGFFAQRSLLDWVFATLVVCGGLFVFQRYLDAMDVYEKGILLVAIPFAVWLGWFWRPLQILMVVVTAFSLLGIWSYQAPAELGGTSLARAESVFWLKYFLSSQSAILWMSVLFFIEHDFLLDRRCSYQTKRRDGVDRFALGLGGRGHGADWHHGALVRELFARC
jgi:hypothetical protein